MSKLIRLPARVQLIEADNLTGSYPTAVKTGDRDRSGKSAVLFDDTSTIVFSSATNISLPTGLSAYSSLLGSNALITVTGSVRKGVADEFAVFKHNVETLKPFDESVLFEQQYKDNVFFKTGSALESVGFGFTNQLSSKTIIEIDVVPQTAFSCSVEFSQTTPAFPLAYYNFEKKGWEGVGLGTPIRDYVQRVIDTAPLGIGASINQPTSGPTLNVRGTPISNFGFPAHAKFHATSSQLLDMSGLINHPFVVEKLIYEFSASFDWAAGGVGSFIILNQRKPASFSKSVVTQVLSGSTYTLTMSLPTTVQLTTQSAVTYVDDIRDVVTFSKVGMQSNDSLDVDLLISNSPVIANPQSTGSYILTSSIKSPSINAVGALKIAAPDITKTLLLENHFGSRNGMGTNTGRDLIAGISGLVPTGSITVSDGDTAIVRPNKFPYLTNPYIILPNDKLIMAWHVAYSYSTGRTAMALLPGKGKIRLYGSLLSDAKEYHDTLNQNLTTNAVHSVIGDDPVLDQFLTEPAYLYSGSNIGEFLTGSISTNRRVITTTFDSGTIPYTAVDFFDKESRAAVIGFNRFAQYRSVDERFYDTVLPKVGDVITALGGRVYDNGNSAVIVLGHVDPTGFGELAETNWNRAFPFEPKFSSVNRSLSDVVTAKTTSDLSLNPVASVERPVRLARATPAGADGAIYLYKNASEYARGDAVILKDFYGVGSYLSGSPQPTALLTDVGYGGPKPRGFKYGILNAEPNYTSAAWRYDRYGQFRDMLEQRLDGKMLIDSSIGNPRPGPAIINVRFVEQNSSIMTAPAKTHSSNLSNEATSSVPYFDGFVKNREDPIDANQLNSTLIAI